MHAQSGFSNQEMAMTILNRVLRGTLLGSVLMVAAAVLGCATLRLADVPSARPPHRPIVIRDIRHGIVNSLNWSGYAVTGAPGSVTNAKGSWIVPSIQGACGASNQYASFWVGIDGFNSNTVEQIGVDADCQTGVPTYYAWFELYPHPFFIINGFTISPGNTVSAEVQYDGGGRFTLSITNVTTGQSFSTSAKVHSAQRSSAEWIAEAPSGASGVLPLADFGTASYGFDTTAVSSTCDATVNGTTGGIGGFGASIQQITMVSNSGRIKAQPSSLSSDGASFSDSWVSSGP